MSDVEIVLRIEALKKEIDDLKKENMRLHKTLEEYGIEEQSPISDIEFICVNEIKKLKAVSQLEELTMDHVKNLDTLAKNLRMARGEFNKKEPIKGAKQSVAELLKIVESE